MSRRAVSRPDLYPDPPLSIDYDRNSGTVIIEGVRYSTEALRALGTASGLYQVSAGSGVLTMQRVRPGAGTCLICGVYYKELAKHAKGCSED